MMTKQQWVMLLVVIALLGGTAAVLARFQTSQKLGMPGVKTEPIPGTNRLQVVLPPNIRDAKGEYLEIDAVSIGALPADTSFGQARYQTPDGFHMGINVVLMGRDRASLHKPQFCLTGQGWNIDNNASAEDTVRVQGPEPYDLPVVKLVSSRVFEQDGQQVPMRGVYVYWYVADDSLSASVSGFERMWSMASHLFRTGVLQRWAYVSCFSVCSPGQEDATYARMKELIALAVPEFQKKPGIAAESLASK